MLRIDKQAAVIGALAEGSSIRSVEHMTGLHLGPVTSLLLAVRDAIVKEFRDNAAIEEA
jgi:hypothetical protein